MTGRVTHLRDLAEKLAERSEPFLLWPLDLVLRNAPASVQAVSVGASLCPTRGWDPTVVGSFSGLFDQSP